MKISVIGSGNVGSRLGALWAQKGHEICFGTRNPEKPELQRLMQETMGNIQACSVAEAVERSEVVLLAVPWRAVHETIALTTAWRDKILIDATNRLDQPAPGAPPSAAEEIAALTGAKVVKAFNAIGAEHLEQPIFSGRAASIFICGDDPEAKNVVRELVMWIGFDCVDVGALSQAPLVESLAKLWISLAIGGVYGREIAFKLLRRDA